MISIPWRSGGSGVDGLPEHSIEVAHQYARDVLSGKVIAGKLVREACQRHLDVRLLGGGVCQQVA